MIISASRMPPNNPCSASALLDIARLPSTGGKSATSHEDAVKLMRSLDRKATDEIPDCNSALQPLIIIATNFTVRNLILFISGPPTPVAGLHMGPQWQTDRKREEMEIRPSGFVADLRAKP